VLGPCFRKRNCFRPRLAIMEYDIRPHEEAYDATMSGIFIVLMVVVTVLLVVFPS